MRSITSFLVYAACILTVSTVQARQLHVANGDDIKTAIEALVAGDTLWVEAGTYEVSDLINVRKSGNRYHRICVFGEGGRAILDFSKQPHTGDDYAGQFRGVLMNPFADYWYWRDIDFTHAADNGMKLEASYCVIERCNFYRNGDTGLQLGFDKDGNGGNNRNPKYLFGRYNQIINCDSYYNYDVQDHGGNADGFANKLFPGPGNEWHGDRCWANSDDGWDLYYATYPCLIDNCWAIYNGYLEDGSIGVNGNGFKQGGNKQGGGSYGAHIFMNCVAAYNLYHGFDQNNHNEGNWIINCTAFANKQVNFRFNCDVEMLGGTVFHLRNCLGFRPGEANHRFGDMWPDSEYTNWQDIMDLSPQYNMGKGTNPKTGKEYRRLSARDWQDISSWFEDVTLETALSPRQANGELPLHFARPRNGEVMAWKYDENWKLMTQKIIDPETGKEVLDTLTEMIPNPLIDAGMPIENFRCEDIFQEQYMLPGKWLDDYSTTVTLPYYGAAPDYGAYEAGWERPAYNLETLPVNDGTLFDPTPVVSAPPVIGGSPADNDKQYTLLPLIDDYLFQDNTLPAAVTQYLTGTATDNKILPTYYGKSGNYPTKIGALYGGGTKGAYMLAKSNGYIELTLPSLSILRSFLYGGGKSSTIKVQWKRPGDSGWTDGETFTFDQRCMAIDFTHYGVPQTVEPIVVRLNSTGSNDVYMTSLDVAGFQEYIDTGMAPVVSRPADIQLTANGIIVYGDVAAITVFNATGQQVAHAALSQFCNLSALGRGIYVVSALMKDGNTVSTKIMRK